MNELCKMWITSCYLSWQCPYLLKFIGRCTCVVNYCLYRCYHSIQVSNGVNDKGHQYMTLTLLSEFQIINPTQAFSVLHNIFAIFVYICMIVVVFWESIAWSITANEVVLNNNLKKCIYVITNGLKLLCVSDKFYIGTMTGLTGH